MAVSHHMENPNARSHNANAHIQYSHAAMSTRRKHNEKSGINTIALCLAKLSFTLRAWLLSSEIMYGRHNTMTMQPKPLKRQNNAKLL